MSTKPLKGSLPDEHILQVEPPLHSFVNAGWRSRPHLYTGRALSAEALSSEQLARAGHLALRGQKVAPGVLAGLEVRLEQELDEATEQQVHFFQIGPGLGLTHGGEDVLIPRMLRFRVDKVPAFWIDEVHAPSSFDLSVLAYVDAPATHSGLQAGVLMLVPTVSRREDLPDPNDPAEVDPERQALADEKLVDGCALVIFAWPKHWPLPARDEQWRNHLAWALFERERLRPPEELAPWDELGVPLSLVGFDPPASFGAPARPLFADRAAVVRQGGAPRSRTPLLEAHGSPLLWQARIQQFSEHLASFTPEQITSGAALQSLAFLPPVGTLPKYAIDLFGRTHEFFPPAFNVEAVPMSLEQLDAVAVTSASLAPLSTTEAERVRVLVPVPDAHFEPRLLHTEVVDPSFEQAITSGLERLAEWLRRRRDLRGKAVLLLNALEGERQNRFPAQDPASIPGEYEGQPLPQPSPYGPEEGAYGTEGNTVPVVDEALWLNGTWAQPERLGSDSLTASTAVAPEQGSFAVLSSYLSYYYGTYLTMRRYSNGVLAARELVFYPWATVDFRTVWTNNEPVIAILALSRYLWSDGSQPHVALMRRGPNGWTTTSGAVSLGVVRNAVLHFTAVSWAPGCVDVFVATTTDIRKVTWINGVPSPLEVLPLNLSRGVNQIVALSPAQGRIELLYLGRTTTSNEPYWLHHLSAFHEGSDPQLRQEGGSATLTVREIRSLRGFQLTACVSRTAGLMPERLDALVMGNDTTRGIRHGWFENGSWKPGMELVSLTSGDALSVVSKGDGRMHAFWWDSTPPTPGPLMYRLFDEGRWQPPELLTQQFLYVAFSRQPFGVVLDGTNPIDLFLASNTGLLHLKKVADSTRETVRKQGLRGLIGNIEGLYQQALDFVRTSTAQVQAEIQHLRQLMLTSSTEASRLAVSATLGSTLVDSPLVVRPDADNYLTRFHPRTSVARIRLSEAMEALEQATSIRRDLTVKFVDLVKKIIRVKEIGLDVTKMTLPGVAQVVSTGGPKRARLVLAWRWKLGRRLRLAAKVVERTDIPLRNLLENPAILADAIARIDEEPENVRRALAHSRLRWTESDYFSTSIRHLENMLIMLRALERRMQTRVRSVENYRAALLRVEGFWSSLDKRLRLVDGEVAEARQDVTVARALLIEEQARIAAINQRRRNVFDQHVPFLVFQRPRATELTEDTPTRMLDPGFFEDILPDVFESTAAAPPELLAYVELIRDSPLRWFSLAASVLRKLDRTELIHRTFEWALVRARQRLPVRLPLIPNRTSPRIAQGLSRLLSAREDLIARQRGVFLNFQPAVLQTRTWMELQQSAHEQLSLGDLTESAHGRSDVGRTVATELERISKVATGLYQRFGEVLPAIRLEWAEEMSQYDTSVELRDLSLLPRWSELDVTDRRELQALVDWLFQRVVSTESEANALINDLVRVCMLLASHAPVNELLSGHVSKPSVVKVGGTLELAVDPSRVRVGMHVLIRSDSHTVRAVVEDLASTVVRTRVLSTTAPTVHLPEKTSAHFTDPSRGPGALMALLGHES